MLWQILTRRKPYDEVPAEVTINDLSKKIIWEDFRPTIPKDAPTTIAKLISSCWEADQNKRPNCSEIIIALDESILDLAISDQKGNRFWRQNFKGNESVEWGEFFTTFEKVYKLKAPQHFQLLKTLFAYRVTDFVKTEERYLVNRERFGQMLDYFGPFDHPHNNMLERILSFAQQRWFHGDVNTDDIPSILAGEDRGAFFVRFSEAKRGYYSICYISMDNEIENQFVRRKVFELSDNKFEEQYITQKRGGTKKFYSSMETLMRDQPHLTKPCSSSLYSKITLPKVKVSLVSSSDMDELDTDTESDSLSS